MPVPLHNMRDLLMPGLMANRAEYTAMMSVWENEFAVAAIDTAILPVVSPVAAVAAAAAAAVIRNQVVTRRFLPWRRE